MNIKQSPKRLRVVELLLVCGVALSGPVYGSLYYFFGGAQSTPDNGQIFLSLINELLALSVLAYVLFRQQRTLKEIGFEPAWRDLPRSLALAIGGYVAFYVAYCCAYYTYYAVRGHVPPVPDVGRQVFGAHLQWAIIILVLINPFFEEVVVRGYLMTEVEYATSSRTAAVAVSVGLQTLYHLYQGIALALGEAGLFAVFALYFSRTRRIMPVILAHLIFDLTSLIQHAYKSVG